MLQSLVMTLYIEEADQCIPVWNGWSPLVQTVYWPDYSTFLTRRSFGSDVTTTIDHFYEVCRPFLPGEVRYSIFTWMGYLVSNSLDAAIANGLHNPISLRMHCKGIDTILTKKWLSFDVVDSSGGFPQDALEFMYGRDAREYPSAKTFLGIPQEGGAGEALNIIHSRVTNHGGKVVKGNYYNTHNDAIGAFVRILIPEEKVGSMRR